MTFTFQVDCCEHSGGASGPELAGTNVLDAAVRPNAADTDDASGPLSPLTAKLRSLMGNCSKLKTLAIQKKRTFSSRFRKSKPAFKSQPFTSVFSGAPRKFKRTVSTSFSQRQRLLLKQHIVSRVKNVIIRHCTEGDNIRQLLKLPLSKAIAVKTPKLELDDAGFSLIKTIKTEPVSPVSFQATDVSDMFFSIKPDALIKVENEGETYVETNVLQPAPACDNTAADVDQNQNATADETLAAILKSNALNMLEKAMLRKEYLNNSLNASFDLDSMFEHSEEHRKSRTFRHFRFRSRSSSKVRTRVKKASVRHAENIPRSFKNPHKRFRSMYSMGLSWRHGRQTANSTSVRGPQPRRSGRMRKENRRYRSPSPQPQQLKRSSLKGSCSC